MTTMAFIEFDHVAKTYDSGGTRVHALKDANLGIDEKDFAAVMGPSGSGKSTLLTMLGVLNTPTKGILSIDGIDVYGLPLERQADFRSEYIGFVFQAFQLIPYLTAAENVMLPLAITKHNGTSREKAHNALAEVGLTDKADRLPNQLSGGETQRVAIARAIVNDPPLVLADEPTGNLDSRTAAGIMDLLDKLNRQGQTIVMVTHDAETAKRAHRIIELKDGEIHKK